MAKKTHPADAADRALIAQAISYNVHLRRSPTSKINRPAATLAEAIAIADEIGLIGTKRAMIYAILPAGSPTSSTLIPNDMIDAARNQAAPAGEPTDCPTDAEAAAGQAEAASACEPPMAETIFEPTPAPEADDSLTEDEIAAEEAGDGLDIPAFIPAFLIKEAKARPTREEKPEATGPAGHPIFANGAKIAKAAQARKAEEALKAKAKKIEPATTADKTPAPAPAASKPAKAPKAPAETKPAAAPKEGSPRALWLAREQAAERGEIPSAPDFSAATHDPYRARLNKIIAMAEAGDLAGLKEIRINPINSSLIPLDRYRNLCVKALELQAASKQKAA
jgi:hypothetical protein